MRPLPDLSPLRAVKARAVQILPGLLDPVVPTVGRIASNGDYYEWLYAYGKVLRPRTVCEIGVLGGGSIVSLALGAGSALQHVTLIDNESHGGDQLAVPLALAAERLRMVAPSCEIVLHAGEDAGDSQRMRTLPSGPLFDLIYVDGDHRYGPCLHDLRISLPRLAPDGHLLADDAQWAWVKWAVDDFVAAHGWLDDLFVETATGTRILHAHSHLDRCPLLAGCGG